ncbi:family with sequence similarity 214 member A [Chelydra serpentina]|uniref:Atos homolog protein A n=1 Tax=Chelydra serpentina TaxID=8475 RepID=A0A8T1TFN1_CHESE|nr:family with sequence similarity 214 member A [Chelydra serpentina]
MVYSGNKGLHREDTLDEYFEYEAEEFLVSLALLITEGRTPEFSVKGRTEGFHCPPAQSSQPLTSKHECTDKLAQCRQARRTRSEVMLLWKNNIPIMIEVMLLPDCCYSDEGPTTEGSDLNDPAIKQDALLLERWILEPVPRQSGDRFIEEKTLLLAVRSFVFFSQLSAWLSVSHGAVPRNILYRVSAADVDLQWTFSQTPTEHVFPVPNVSHNVALKVSVQSLPRQSNYPVLTCSIHTSLGFYEKGIQEHNVHRHCDSIEGEQRSVSSSQRSCGKQTWTLIPEGLFNAKISPEFTTSVRNVKLYPTAGFGSAFGTSQSKVQCYNAMGDNKTQPCETSVRTFKSFSLVDPQVPNSHCSRHPIGETNPLIGSLLQERQEVIARIAQHLIHCDPSTSHVTGCPFNMHETSSVTSKVFWNTYEDESLLKKGKEISSVSTANTDTMLSEECSEDKTRAIQENPLVYSHVPMNHCSRQSIGEINPLIGSLLLERQEVIARIAQHLLHCDPVTSHITGRPFNVHESSSITSKVFQSSYEDENLLKKGKETSSISFSKSDVTIKDSSKVKTRTPDTPLTSCRLDGELKASPKPQARRKLILAKPSEVVQNTFQQTPNKTTNSFTSINVSCSKENKSELPDKLETILSGCPHKDQMTNKGIGKQCSNFNTTDEQICKNKLKERTVTSENSNGDCLINPQLAKSKILEGTKKATLMQASDILHKNELKCLDKDSKKSTICEQNTQLVSIENYLNKDHDSFKCKSKQDKLKTAHDENEDPTDYEFQSNSQKKSVEDYLARCERLKNADMLRIPPLKHSSIWRKHNFHSLDGTITKAFHPRTGLPLLSSPVPQRKTQSGCFDLDSSLLRLKCLSTRSPQQCINTDSDPEGHGKPFLSSSAPPITSLSLLGNFEESVLNYRLDPLGIVDGFTAEVGASGVFCPTHMTLPVEVSFYSVSDDNAPSPYMGVITLETLGKRGYRVPPSGTIQVTLFNPNKTVVKMFVVIYDLREMPANHQTFLRQRTFSVPVRREVKRSINKENIRQTEERLLRYLIHLRFQSSKSGKIYLHRDVRLLFSRKSMEVDSGAAYELKSYTESPTNPQFSPRC